MFEPDFDPDALLSTVLALHGMTTADVVDVTLVGSRIMGYATPESDYDVVIWRNGHDIEPKTGMFDGRSLHSVCQPRIYMGSQFHGFRLPRYSLITHKLLNHTEDDVAKWRDRQLARKNRNGNLSRSSQSHR